MSSIWSLKINEIAHPVHFISHGRACHPTYHPTQHTNMPCWITFFWAAACHVKWFSFEAFAGAIMFKYNATFLAWVRWIWQKKAWAKLPSPTATASDKETGQDRAEPKAWSDFSKSAIFAAVFVFRVLLAWWQVTHGQDCKEKEPPCKRRKWRVSSCRKNSAAIQGPLSDCLSGCIRALILMACILALNLS